jgi:hypothetical protein
MKFRVCVWFQCASRNVVKPSLWQMHVDRITKIGLRERLGIIDLTCLQV